MNSTFTAAEAPANATRLPLSGLLALALTGFIAILSETLPAGLLDQVANGMHISQAMAGQWVTAYALGSLLTAIPLVTLTQGWRRRRALLLAVIGFILFNGLTAWPAPSPCLVAPVPPCAAHARRSGPRPGRRRRR